MNSAALAIANIRQQLTKPGMKLSSRLHRFYGTKSTAEIVSQTKQETVYFFHHDRETNYTMPTREFKEKTFRL